MAFGGYGWRRYVSVGEKRARALLTLGKLKKQGLAIEPVEVKGRAITRSFWGKAWCAHLESFSDYSNRLPRGRTYVRNGSVCHLAIEPGRITAKVIGSRLYDVRITIRTLPAATWKAVRERCAGQIASLLELLQGRVSARVMEIVAAREDGLFPQPREIDLHCSCPDWATMCKHVAAVLYGVGARLDTQPELLFRLRQVDPDELISVAPDLGTRGEGKARRLVGGDLSALFGVEMAAEETREKTGGKKTGGKKTGGKKTGGKKTGGKKTARVDGKERVRGSRKRAAAPSGKKRVPAAKGKSAGARPAKAAHEDSGSAPDKVFVPTASAVRAMRKRFGMTRAEFAELLGLGPGSVGRWERAGPGRLRLKALATESLSLAADLSREDAWRVLRS